MKTLWLNPNLHIEFDLPLRAALIFPLSHTVQCTASDTPMEIEKTVWFHLQNLQWAKIEAGWEGWEEEERMGGIQGMGLMRVWRGGKWICSFDVLHVCEHDSKWHSGNSVGVIFFFWVAISQFRDAELLASLQGMWLGALCPGGDTGRALT